MSSACQAKALHEICRPLSDSLVFLWKGVAILGIHSVHNGPYLLERTQGVQKSAFLLPSAVLRSNPSQFLCFLLLCAVLRRNPSQFLYFSYVSGPWNQELTKETSGRVCFSLELEVMVLTRKGMGQDDLIALTAEQLRVVNISLLSRYVSLEFWTTGRWVPFPHWHFTKAGGWHQQDLHGPQKHVWALSSRNASVGPYCQWLVASVCCSHWN